MRRRFKMLALFPNDPKFVAQNWIPIEHDPSVWDVFITNRVRKIVDNPDMDITIVWNMKDESKGYGVGSAIVTNKYNEQKFVVPVILKNFKVAPLDVVITDRHAMRLNNNTAADLLFNSNLGSAVDDPMDLKGFSRPSQTGPDNNSGSIGGYDNSLTQNMDSYNFVQIAQKSASVDLRVAWLEGNADPFIEQNIFDKSLLVDIYGTVENDQISKAATELYVPEVLNKFSNEKSIFVDMLDDKGFEVKKDTNIGCCAGFEENNGPAAPTVKKLVKVVKKVGPNAYVMMSSSIDNFAPVMDLASGGNVRFVLRESGLSDGPIDAVLLAAESAEERGAVVPNTEPVYNGTAEIYSDLNDPDTSDDPGVYEVYDNENVPYLGVLFTKIIDLMGEKKNEKVVITNNGGNKVGSDFRAVPAQHVQYSLWNEYVIPSAMYPSAGDSGGFYAGPSLIGPMTILSKSYEHGNDTPTFVATDGNVQTVIKFSDYMDKGKIDFSSSKGEERDVMTLPIGIRWVTINNEIEYHGKKKKNILEKDATVRHIGNDLYTLRGFADIPEDWATAIPEAETKYALSTQGFKADQIYGMLAESNKMGSCKVTGVKKKPTPSDKPVQKKASISWDPWRFDLIKCASMLDNMDTVDKVLGLNFLNESNVGRFITALPQLENTREELVRLLIVSRLGLNEVPETAIIQASDALDEVIDGLKRLRLANAAT
jgi:hypothetical protein